MAGNHHIPHTEEAKRKMSEARAGKPCLWKRKVTKIIDGIELFLCTQCHQYLPKTDFYTTSRRVHGIISDCKKCHCKNSVISGQRHPEKKRRRNREYMRRARNSDPAKFQERECIASRKREKNEKTKARIILNSAVATGKIIKPTNCYRCGKVRKVTAHHDDYSCPLQVRWLCTECHGEQTIKERSCVVL